MKIFEKLLSALSLLSYLIDRLIKFIKLVGKGLSSVFIAIKESGLFGKDNNNKGA